MRVERLAKILLEAKSSQSLLLNFGDFMAFARSRKVDVSQVDKSVLENLDKAGILRPVLKIKSIPSRHLVLGRRDGILRYDIEPLQRKLRKDEEETVIYRHWNPRHAPVTGLSTEIKGRLINSSSRWFQDWERFNDENGQTRITYWYHPFQIVRLRQILSCIELRIQCWNFRLDSKSLGSFTQSLRATRRALQSSEPDFLKKLAIVIAAEELYCAEDLKTGAKSNSEVSDEPDFSGKISEAILQSFNVSVVDIQNLFHGFAWAWHSLNELGDWHLLAKHADNAAKGQFTGRCRLGWDYHELAEKIKALLEAKIGSQSSVEQIVKVGNNRPISARNCDQPAEISVPSILRQFQLDPRYRVLFAVEGPTEERFIETWCQLNNINLKRLGIRILPFFGTGGLRSPSFKIELENARDTHAYVVLVVDDENDSKDSLNRLISEGLVYQIHSVEALNNLECLPVGAFIWKSCFEDANFTPDQLAEAWVSVQRRLSSSRAEVSTEVLLSKMRKRHEHCNSWLSSLLQVTPKGVVSKPELAKELAMLTTNMDCTMTRLIRSVVTLAKSKSYWNV